MANARVAVSFTQDTLASAHARVHLKIGAMAYADALHLGDPPFAGAALSQLCALAARYYAVLTGRSEILKAPLASEASLPQLVHLRLAALGYANARHGSDACVELARDALGLLCAAAIAYCSALLNVEPSGVVDRTLHIDG